MAFVPPHTIEDALVYCGMLINTANLVGGGSSTALKIAAEVFNNNFTTCLDIEFSELEVSWKTYSSLTVY